MWRLLKETLVEIWRHRLDVIKCFWTWPIFCMAVLAIAGLLVISMESEPERNLDFEQIFSALAVVLCLFALIVSPAAIRWHQLMISGRPVSWLPARPNWSSYKYALITSVLSFAFLVFSKLSSSIWQDLFMPIVGLLTGGRELSAIEYQAFDWIFAAAMPLAFAYIFGKFYLRLPEMSVDEPMRGARKAWSKRERRQFYLALLAILLLPSIISQVELAASAANSAVSILQPLTLVATLLSSIMGLTLLSVVYQKNLENRNRADKTA